MELEHDHLATDLENLYSLAISLSIQLERQGNVVNVIPRSTDVEATMCDGDLIALLTFICYLAYNHHDDKWLQVIHYI